MRDISKKVMVMVFCLALAFFVVSCGGDVGDGVASSAIMTVAIAAGNYHSVGLKADGIFWAWG